MCYAGCVSSLESSRQLPYRRLYIAELQDWIAKLEKYKSNRNKTALVAAEFRSKASSILGGFAPLGTDPTEDHSAEVERVLTLLQSELYKSKQSLKAREYQRGSYIDCILRNLPKRRLLLGGTDGYPNFSTIVLLDETTRPYQDRLTEDSIRHEASRGESTNDSSPKQDFVRECMEGIVPGLYERLRMSPLPSNYFNNYLSMLNERNRQTENCGSCSASTKKLCLIVWWTRSVAVLGTLRTEDVRRQMRAGADCGHPLAAKNVRLPSNGSGCSLLWNSQTRILSLARTVP